ncbi:A-kinase anchor protein 6-like protein, partial [Lates japonicus]
MEEEEWRLREGGYRRSAGEVESELISSQCEAQRAALEQMAIKLSSLRYPTSTNRRHYSQLARSN